VTAAGASGGPSVSLVIPTRGRPAHLARLLGALRFQTLRSFEVIVVGDSDPGPAARPFPLRYLPLSEANVSRARNMGVMAAAAPLVAFIDDDSVPEFGWLQHLVPALASPRVGSACGYVRGRNGIAFESRVRLFDRHGNDSDSVLAGNGVAILPPSPSQCLKTPGTNCAFRRSALAAAGGFDESFPYFMDETDLNLRLAKAGWMAAVAPKAEVHHAAAASALRSSRRVPLSLYEIGAGHALFLKKHAPDEDHAGPLAAVRRAQTRRLHRLFGLGLIEEGPLRAVLATLENGFADGAARAPQPGLDGLSVLDKAVAHEIRPNPAQVLASGLASRWRRRAEAAAAAAQGQAVTLVESRLDASPSQVVWDDAGYWRHRSGRFRYRQGAAVTPQSELARIGACRYPDAAPVD
jgi:GT2 family glycosyltransferase